MGKLGLVLCGADDLLCPGGQVNRWERLLQNCPKEMQSGEAQV